MATKRVNVEFNNLKSVVDAVGRQERVIQTMEAQALKDHMDLIIMQAYSESIGGTKEGYLEFHKNEMEQIQKMTQDRIQETIDQHSAPSGGGPDILGLDGKPLKLEQVAINPAEAPKPASPDNKKKE